MYKSLRSEGGPQNHTQVKEGLISRNDEEYAFLILGAAG